MTSSGNIEAVIQPSRTCAGRGVEFDTTVVDREPPATPNDSPPLDADGLLERCLGKIEFAQSLIAQFQLQFDGELEALGEKISAADAEGVRSLSHRLKGTTATVSAPALQKTLAELERLGSLGQTSDMPDHFAILCQQWSRFSDYVDTCFREEGQNSDSGFSVLDSADRG